MLQQLHTVGELLLSSGKLAEVTRPSEREQGSGVPAGVGRRDGTELSAPTTPENVAPISPFHLVVGHAYLSDPETPLTQWIQR